MNLNINLSDIDLSEIDFNNMGAQGWKSRAGFGGRRNRHAAELLFPD